MGKAIGKVEDLQMEFEIKGHHDAAMGLQLDDINKKLDAMKNTEKQAKKLALEIQFMLTDVSQKKKALLAGLKDLRKEICFLEP